MVRRTASFTLWLIAAVLAVMTAFGPTSAFAHAGHDHHGQMAAYGVAPAPAGDPRTASVAASGKASLSRSQLLTEMAKGAFGVATPASTVSAIAATPHSSCDGACCNCGNCGGGCCSAACIVAEGPRLPPVDLVAKPPLPDHAAVNGASPSSLLEPPNAFA